MQFLVRGVPLCNIILHINPKLVCYSNQYKKGLVQWNIYKLFFGIFIFHTDLHTITDMNYHFLSVVFPMDFLEKGIWGKNMAMLGLGDIVIPGIYNDICNRVLDLI